MKTEHEKKIEKHLEEISNNVKFFFWATFGLAICGAAFIAIHL